MALEWDALPGGEGGLSVGMWLLDRLSTVLEINCNDGTLITAGTDDLHPPGGFVCVGGGPTTCTRLAWEAPEVP